tara:strand:- start:839 stop:1405 length:567 start_codon:yes stop_codon:yes gene_type:complete
MQHYATSELFLSPEPKELPVPAFKSNLTTKKKKKDDRPTFQYRGMPVRAAGVLVYTFDGYKTHRLFRNIKGRFEDIGGKTDTQDHNEIDTAVRECVEETHGKLFDPNHTKEMCASILRDLIASNCQTQYNKKSKYLLFKLNVHPGILKMPMKRFGLKENTDWGVLEHYYQWKDRIPRNRHPRLWGLKL